MDGLLLYKICLWFLLITALISFPFLFFFTAPYGRHMQDGWGPRMDYKLGWYIMEVPPPFIFAAVFFMGANAMQLVPLVILVIWELHYFYRSIIFPGLIRGGGKRKPVAAVVSGFVFNLLNGYMIAYAVSNLAPHLLDSSWLVDPRFIVGVLMMVCGLSININSDAILRNLRQPGESGYKIPQGGLYRWVTSPNYLGEIIEWCGFAIATWTPAGAVFAIFTIANLFPRAFAHHRWYRRKFSDYPQNRKAIIPGVL